MLLANSFARKTAVNNEPFSPTRFIKTLWL